MIRKSATPADSDSAQSFSDIDVWDIVGRLKDFAFIKEQKKLQGEDLPTFEQHRLLQLSIRNTIEPTEARKFSREAQENHAENVS